MAIVVCLTLPGLELRIHHYILALLLLPGTGIQTRTSLCIKVFSSIFSLMESRDGVSLQFLKQPPLFNGKVTKALQFPQFFPLLYLWIFYQVSPLNVTHLECTRLRALVYWSTMLSGTEPISWNHQVHKPSLHGPEALYRAQSIFDLHISIRVGL